MKKIIGGLLLCLLFSGCHDFFVTDPDDIYNADDYMGAPSEIYAGYFGLITRMQEVGDQAIFLTDLRADYLEPTNNAPKELLDIYKYGDLTGNTHADPKGYYSLIIACNDYIQKAFEYKEKHPEAVTENHFPQLIGGALRFKAWAYFMLGKIYGEAIYFDDPMVKYQDISKFPVLKTDQIVQKCIELLTVGVSGIDGSGSLKWVEVVDPDHPNEAKYVFWGLCTPNYESLLAELSLWAGDYQKVVDLLLPFLNEALTESADKFSVNYYTNTRRERIFAYQVDGLSKYLVSAIPYDSDNGQTNRIFTYFEDIYPCQYYVCPSEYGVTRYQQQIAKDGTAEEPKGDRSRGSGKAYKESNGHYKVAMFYNSSQRSIFENDVHINIYRGHDLHFMLIEALNHLGNWKAAEVLLNSGVLDYDRTATYVEDETSVFYGFNKMWSATQGDLGVRGCSNLSNIPLTEGETVDGKPVIETAPNEARIKEYDLALLDEALLEFPCEGKVYPLMIRMALRYQDPAIVADRVCPKYPESMREDIRAKIMSGGYFVKWDL